MPQLDDAALFLDQATWFARHLPQPTLGEFACWLARWLQDGPPEAFEELYRLDHPDQEPAERALVEILESTPRRRLRLTAQRDACLRNTDWAETLSQAHPCAPVKFIERLDATTDDSSLIAALSTVGRQWQCLLQLHGHMATHQQRAARLKRAVQPFPRQAALTTGHMRRLARLPGMERRCSELQRALQLISAPLTSDRAKQAMNKLAARLHADHNSALKNQNNALELSVILAIARAAEHLDWKVRSNRSHDRQPKPALTLENGNLRCGICKGRFDIPPSAAPAPDVLAQLEQAALNLDSRRRQPDVVISFWRADRPEERLFCIAEAKRNASGDGIGYLKESVTAMTAYMVAFSEPLRAQLNPKLGGFSAPLMPAATLFVTQNAGASATAIEPKHWLAALDARHYATTRNQEWDPTHVAQWFTCLWRSASEALKTCGPSNREPLVNVA